MHFMKRGKICNVNIGDKNGYMTKGLSVDNINSVNLCGCTILVGRKDYQQN
jgi:hypothetical protein